MRKSILLATVLLFVVAPRVMAQQSSGTFTMLVGGSPVGTEMYTITEEPAGNRRAVAEISLGGRKQSTTTIFSNGRPVSFLTQSGNTKLVSASFDGSAVKVQIAGGAEKQLTTKATVILENAVWHHFIFLLRQYDTQKGGKQSLTVFLPSQTKEYLLQVERTATAVVSVEGKATSVESYQLVTETGLTFQVWTDASRTPILILIETQGVKVVRLGSELLANEVLKPVAPETFSSEEIAFKNGEIKLAGILTIPKGGEGRYPAVLLISGTGLQDRDGNPGAVSLYKLVAEKLSANGIAVLRHDDRGIGQSTIPKSPTTYSDLINDSKSAVQYLRSRREINPDRIILIGHSEGGITATIMAAEDADISAIVLLAGAFLSNLEQLVLEQTIYQQALAAPFNPLEREKFPQIVRWLITQIDEAKAGKPDTKPADVHEYMRQHLALNQSETFRKVRCPILILQGERDALVLAYHAVASAKAFTDAGNRQVTVRIFPNLSHTFTPSPLDPGIAVEKKNQVNPEVLETVQKWIAGTAIDGKQKSEHK